METGLDNPAARFAGVMFGLQELEEQHARLRVTRAAQSVRFQLAMPDSGMSRQGKRALKSACAAAVNGNLHHARQLAQIAVRKEKFQRRFPHA